MNATRVDLVFEGGFQARSAALLTNETAVSYGCEAVKTAIIHSVCECQAKLGAVLDERRHVVRGFAKDRRTGREAIAPAHSIGAQHEKFEVGWACPFCTRNQVRSFDAQGIAYRDGQAA